MLTDLKDKGNFGEFNESLNWEILFLFELLFLSELYIYQCMKNEKMQFDNRNA